MAPDDAEFAGKLFWMTAAPEELSTLFVISLKARFTEKLRPWIYCVAEPLLAIIFGSWTLEERAPVPVLGSINSLLVNGFWFLKCIILIPALDIFRWFVPIPILVDAPGISILCPLLTMFEGSMFSFLFWCIEVVLPWLDPLLQIPLSICFFYAIPELMLLIKLFTPLLPPPL